MTSFEPSFIRAIRFDHGMVRALRAIGTGRGQQDLFRERAPELLEHLRRRSMIESTESSNRLEGITVPAAVLRHLVRDNANPVEGDRPQGEIAGYRNVLNLIHESSDVMAPSPNLLLQMHRDLFKFSGGTGGRWKAADNLITQTAPDGTVFVRFKPTPAWQTPEAVDRLHQGFASELDGGPADPLVLIALYVLDFLCIHPFADGNGRMARLLTVLLLYRHGYEVAKWISIEQLYERTKDSYYDTLYQSSQGWHESRHDPLPWVSYFLSVIQAAYFDLEFRLGDLNTSHGVKKQLVLDAIERAGDSFRIGDIENAVPTVGRDHIRNVLREQRQAGHLRCEEKGRYARWRKT